MAGVDELLEAVGVVEYVILKIWLWNGWFKGLLWWSRGRFQFKRLAIWLINILEDVMGLVVRGIGLRLLSRQWAPERWLL